MAGSIELAAVFERAAGDRLLAAERLVLSLPQLARGLLAECDLAYKASTRFLAVVARLASRGYGHETQARLAFWTARAGGLATSLGAMPPHERKVFEAHLTQCDVWVKEVAPQELFEAVSRVITGAGAPADRTVISYPRPTLAMDAGGPGWEGVAYDRDRHALFIPGALAPPVGDEIAVSVRLPGQERPLEARARVAQVRIEEEAAPGAPAGFALALAAPPPELEAALHDLARPGERQRAAPRYPVKAPVKVSGVVLGKVATRKVPAPAPRPVPAKPAAPAPAPEAARPAAAAKPVPAAVPTARIEYASEQELAEDYLENLSQGGAFVRSGGSPPVGTRLTLQMRLPGLEELEAPATVVFVHDYGYGVKFELDEAGRARLAAVIARISARPRRALVVDDDGLVRRMMTDALAGRGFEVLTARDGTEGLHVLVEELLTLDLLVTDVRMPGMDGEAFVRTIREQGGESELAIVVAAGGVDPALEARMTAAGADAVVDKSLGPELVAQAADAALERKRLVRPG